jgi:hypothetical protein
MKYNQSNKPRKILPAAVRRRHRTGDGDATIVARPRRRAQTTGCRRRRYSIHQLHIVESNETSQNIARDCEHKQKHKQRCAYILGAFSSNMKSSIFLNIFLQTKNVCTVMNA